MVSLSEQDVLELLGYAGSQRHPLEILGYECSSRGARRFREEQPDFVPQVCQLIQASLEHTGSFPGNPGGEILRDGTYLERRPDGLISLHTSIEVSMSETARSTIEFTSVRDAAFELIRRSRNPSYLPNDPKRRLEPPY